MSFYDESVLKILATGVGRDIRVYLTRSSFSQGKFAHVCVELDLRGN